MPIAGSGTSNNRPKPTEKGVCHRQGQLPFSICLYTQRVVGQSFFFFNYLKMFVNDVNSSGVPPFHPFLHIKRFSLCNWSRTRLVPRGGAGEGVS